ncbi:hypothetical protein EUGRSUZ_H04595, partial [Eucalyptus grandis]
PGNRPSQTRLCRLPPPPQPPFLPQRPLPRLLRRAPPRPLLPRPQPRRPRPRPLRRRHIKSPQDAVTAIERCRKPVIAAVHGACVRGGVDVATACDVRYCTEDAFFSVKEVDLAIIADLGTLQRLPSIVGYGNAMELALTGRRVSGSEAKELGLVSRVFGSKRELDDGVRVIAEAIASKSLMAVTGTKAVLLKSRDMSIDQGLDYVCLTLFLGMDFN